VHHALGILLQHRNRRKEALGYLLTAAEHAPQEAVIQRDAGAELLLQGRPEDAEPYFSRARKLSPDDLETWVGWGRALYESGERKRAEEVFRAARRIDPGSIDAMVGLALCMVAEDPAGARKLLEPVPAHFADVAVVDGLALERLDRFAEAVPRFVTAVQYAPPDGLGAVVLRDATEGLARGRESGSPSSASSTGAAGTAPRSCWASRSSPQARRRRAARSWPGWPRTPRRRGPTARAPSWCSLRVWRPPATRTRPVCG
jgi:tetratricopeptide (TPR) repeat protein